VVPQDSRRIPYKAAMWRHSFSGSSRHAADGGDEASSRRLALKVWRPINKGVSYIPPTVIRQGCLQAIDNLGLEAPHVIHRFFAKATMALWASEHKPPNAEGAPSGQGQRQQPLE
jgi:hypothetical protein